MIELLFKLIRAMWPFLREMFFGKKGPSDVIRRNKTAVVSVILNILQTITIFVFIDLLISMSSELNLTKAAQKDSNSETKVQLTVLKTTLEQAQSKVKELEEENGVLRAGLLNRNPPTTTVKEDNRRQNLNDRLSRLRGDEP